MVQYNLKYWEAGDYKFIIQTPGNTSGKRKGKKEKVKEKATSGLKDFF